MAGNLLPANYLLRIQIHESARLFTFFVFLGNRLDCSLRLAGRGGVLLQRIIAFLTVAVFVDAVVELDQTILVQYAAAGQFTGLRFIRLLVLCL